MTVENRQQHVTIAAGAVVEGTPITVNWDVQSRSELAVLYGNDLAALLDSDYSVALVPPNYKSATVTPLAGLVEKANGGTVTIRSAVPYVQSWSVPINSRLPENDLQRTEDRDVLRDRQLAERSDLSLSGYFNNALIYDAKNKRVSGVGDPIDPQDAVNVRWAETRLSMGVPAGVGIPPGGDAGDVLTKTSSSDYVSEWRDPRLERPSHAYYPEDFILPEHPDDTIGVQALFSNLAAYGGVGMLSRWYNLSAEINIAAVAQPFSIIGVGRYVCGFNKTRITATAGVLEQILDLTGDKITLRGFGIKGNAHSFGYTDSSHGLSLCGNDLLVEDLWVWNWGLGTGIICSHDVRNVKIRNCHVDGNLNAGNGILLSGVDDGVIEACLVENIHADLTQVEEAQATPCRAVQFKRGVNGLIINNRVKNCYFGLCLNGNDDDEPSVNSRIIGGVVSHPNHDQQSLTQPCGIYFRDAMSCSAEGVTVDGGSVADFYGLYDLNQDYAGTFARFKATNCNGANARVAFIDGWETDVEIESMGAYGTTPIEFGTHSLTCRVRVGQLVGSSTADRMHNPWRYVLNNGNANNRAENLYDDISFRRLEDDEAMQLGVTDATVLLITVWSNSSGHEQFQGWARTSSSPDMEAFFLGGSVVTGTSALSTGGSSGTDGKLNIAAVEGAIHVKNRMGDARNVGIEIRTVF